MEEACVETGTLQTSRPTYTDVEPEKRVHLEVLSEISGGNQVLDIDVI